MLLEDTKAYWACTTGWPIRLLIVAENTDLAILKAIVLFHEQFNLDLDPDEIELELECVFD